MFEKPRAHYRSLKPAARRAFWAGMIYGLLGLVACFGAFACIVLFSHHPTDKRYLAATICCLLIGAALAVLGSGAIDKARQENAGD